MKTFQLLQGLLTLRWPRSPGVPSVHSGAATGWRLCWSRGQSWEGSRGLASNGACVDTYVLQFCRWASVDKPVSLTSTHIIVSCLKKEVEINMFLSGLKGVKPSYMCKKQGRSYFGILVCWRGHLSSSAWVEQVSGWGGNYSNLYATPNPCTQTQTCTPDLRWAATSVHIKKSFSFCTPVYLRRFVCACACACACVPAANTGMYVSKRVK